MDAAIDALKYPIGKYTPPEVITSECINDWIEQIETMPQRLESVVSKLNGEQLDTPYRFGGWKVKQVVHHIADSHMNAFIRFKWTLTEDNPTIKPYFEDRWAQLPDTLEAPVELSLGMIQLLHVRWAILLKTLTPEQLERTYYHPEYQYTVPLKRVMGLYAWHGNHHLRHITALAERNNWQL